ncbi:MAG TPA: M48 family metalloprotease [Blastocatellia bacterium]|nr:M48 family metalloprotease [Blastocatellia bacterium]
MFISLPLDAAGQKSVADFRLVMVMVALFLPIIATGWFRRSALSTARAGGETSSFFHFRFAIMTVVLLPALWWIAISLSESRRFIDGLTPISSSAGKAFIEIIVFAAIPCMAFGVCVLIWQPVWRAIPARVGIPGDPGRSGLHLFAGGFVPPLLIFGGYFYVFEFEFAQAMVLMFAGLAMRAIYKRTLIDREELDLFVLIADDLRKRIFELANAAKVRLNQVLVLPERGHRISNACATSSNTIWLSEFMLRHFSRRETDAIAAHELGHLKRSHAVAKIALSELCLLAGLIPMMFLKAMNASTQHLDLVFPVSLIASTLLYYFSSRRFEYSADWWSAKKNGDPEAMITGLVRLTRYGRQPLERSWLDGILLTHPSTRRRAQRVARKAGIAPARLEELLATDGDSDDPYSLQAGMPAPSPVSPGSANTKTTRQPKGQRFQPIPLGVAVSASILGFMTVPVLSDLQLLGKSYFGISIWYCVIAGSVVLGLTAAALTARRLKTKLSVGLTKQITYAPANPDDLPGLDSTAFRDYRRQLTDLGFVFDGAVASKAARRSACVFQEVFSSQDHNCWASVSQAVTGTLGISKVICSIVSRFESDYWLLTSNNQAAAVLYAGCLPGEIWTHHPGVQVSALLKQHIPLRERIATMANLVVADVAPIDQYVAFMQERVDERMRLLRRVNAWFFLGRIDRFQRRPRLEWTGKDKRIAKIPLGVEESAGAGTRVG